MPVHKSNAGPQCERVGTFFQGDRQVVQAIILTLELKTSTGSLNNEARNVFFSRRTGFEFR